MSATPESESELGYQSQFSQYVDDASFLWILRSIAIKQPHYKKADIVELEKRIQISLDGLMSSMNLGWDVCTSALATEEPGEVFSAAVIAFKSHDVIKIELVVDAGLHNEQTFKGLVSALGWLTPELANPWIDKFLISKNLDHNHLGLAACSIRGDDAGDYLTKILSCDECQQHKKLYIRALRLIGELRRQDLMPAISQAIISDDQDIAFWANWSAILLGNKSAANNFKGYLFNGGIHQRRALHIVFRVLPIDQARQWISEMADDQKLSGAVIQATAALGDPHAVGWLIQKMEEPALARVAGEAFSTITGIDLIQNSLIIAAPFDLESTPNDNAADDNVAMDEDEKLPWPHAKKIALLWQQRGGNFIIGQRYFMGQLISSPWLLNQLEHANQRQRYAAALELALIEPADKLHNIQGRVLEHE